MHRPDRVGGVARISLPVGEQKGAPWITLEASFDYNSSDDTPEARKAKRSEGWAEVQEDLQQQIAETLSSIKEQMGGK
jgi:hypothetical protein